MNKIFSKLLVVFLTAILVFNVTACGEDKSGGMTITTDEAYEAITNAVNKTLTDVKEISVVADGTAEVKMKNEENGDESESDSEMGMIKNNTYGLKANVAVKLGENNALDKAKLYAKLTDKGADSSIILEAYVKDGYSYTYTNIFGSSYGYSEMDDETIDLSDIDMEKVGEYIGKAKTELPKPEATKNGEDIRVVWNITNDNIGDYAKAIGKIQGKETQDDEIAEMLKDIRVNKGKITLVIGGDQIKNINVELDAVRGEEGVKANLTCEISVKNVEIVFDEDRLNEIRNTAREIEENED